MSEVGPSLEPRVDQGISGSPERARIAKASVSGVFLSDTHEKVPSIAPAQGITITDTGVAGDRYDSDQYFVKYGARIPEAALNRLGLTRETVKGKTLSPNLRAVYLISDVEVKRLETALDDVRGGEPINPAWFKVNMVLNTEEADGIELANLPAGTTLRFPKTGVELFLWGPNDPCTRPGNIIQAAGWDIDPSAFPKKAIGHYGAVASVLKGSEQPIDLTDDVEIIYPDKNTAFPELRVVE